MLLGCPCLISQYRNQRHDYPRFWVLCNARP